MRVNPSSGAVDPTLKELFDHLPGCWGCKDNNSVFLYANKEYANLVGVGADNHLDIIGRTDFDMPCETVNCAELFRKQDQAVILEKAPLKILDIHPFAGNYKKKNPEWKAYIFTKIPLYDQNQNIMGTIFSGMNLNAPSIVEAGFILASFAKATQNHHDLLSDKRQNSFLLTPSFSYSNDFKLTTKESECLFFMLRGKTAKQIGQYVNISHRTVEVYFDRLKIKLKASNRGELIDKAIQAGFLNSIPQSLFTRQLSIILREK